MFRALVENITGVAFAVESTPKFVCGVNTKNFVCFGFTNRRDRDEKGLGGSYIFYFRYVLIYIGNFTFNNCVLYYFERKKPRFLFGFWCEGVISRLWKTFVVL